MGELASARPRPQAGKPPIRNLVISCQENRSFDHYFGYAPQVQAKGFGPPPGYSQPDASGGRNAPYELTQLSTHDPPHCGAPSISSTTAARWTASTSARRKVAMGYYTARELPFYYSLFRRLGALRELLLLAAGTDLAQPLLPDVRDVGRDHDQRPVGLRHLRLRTAGRSSSTCSTTPA